MQSSLLLAVAALASGQWIQPRIFDQPNLRSGNARELATYLEFAPASGAGLPVAENLCDALAAEVPNWSTPVDGGAGNWCLGGNGQEVTGSQVDFEPFGSPTPVTATVCPSGPDCTEKSALGLAASGSAAAAALDTGTGPITACWLGSADNAGAGALLTAATGGSTAQISWYIEQGASSVTFYVSSGSVLRSPTMTTPDKNTINLICLSHGGAASAVRPYINGTAGTASATVDRQSISVKPALSGINGTTTYAPVSAVAFGAFYVDQELSAAQIAAIARRVLADQPKALIRGSPSLALTYTRTGNMFCSKADNTGSTLPANRPCISQNGILVEAAATNRVARSQEFDNAAWTKGAGATVTANYALAPDGTKTAERIVYDATSSYVLISDSTGGSQSTQSVFLKGTSGSGAIDFCRGGAPGQCVVCSYTSTEWSRCTHTSTYATSSNGFFGCDAPTKGSACSAAGDVLAWGYQHELGSVATSYIPTTSAAATRGVAVPYFTHGQATYSTGCVAATWAQPVNTDPSGIIMLADGATFKQAIIRSTDFGAWIGGSAAVISSVNPTSVATHRAIASWDGATTSINVNGTVTSAAAGTAQSTTRLYLGSYDATSSTTQTGRYSLVQFDPRPTRCR